MNLITRFSVLAALAFTVGSSQVALAADHADTPLLRSIGRHDARITDLHTFVRGSDLVITLSTNPTIPAGVTDYIFPSDVEYKIHIDNKSKVSFADPEAVAKFGGTIVKPSKIKDRIEIEIGFEENGEMKLEIEGLKKNAKQLVSVFTGLRDDPFIRTPRAGRNIAAIVVQIPLSAVLKKRSTILVWATTDVDDIAGSQHELGGYALRSQFPEADLLNTTDPSRHTRDLGVRPDVLIFDTSRPASFPNGRELTDDVVDLVCDLVNECRVQNSDAPFPTQNDVPFLQDFPYLGEPQVNI